METSAKARLVSQAGSSRPGASAGGWLGDCYKGIPKHKEPWVTGRRGTLCPPGVDGPALFAEAITDPKRPGKRYATDGDNAYCAHSSNIPTPSGGYYWHGFPYEWRRIPAAVQRQWIAEGKIKGYRTS